LASVWEDSVITKLTGTGRTPGTGKRLHAGAGAEMMLAAISPVNAAADAHWCEVRT